MAYGAHLECPPSAAPDIDHKVMTRSHHAHLPVLAISARNEASVVVPLLDHAEHTHGTAVALLLLVLASWLLGSAAAGRFRRAVAVLSVFPAMVFGGR